MPPWDSRPNAKNWGSLCHHSLCDLTCSLPMDTADGPVTEAESQTELRRQWSWYPITHNVRTVRPSQAKVTKALQSKEKIKASFAGSLDHSSPDVPKRETVKKEHRWRGRIPLQKVSTAF